ncbi:SETMR methyltransferase, partial [Acromyrmex charruanus]
NLCIFCKMEENEFRAVIKHLYKKRLMPKEIKVVLDNVHSTSAPAFATVYNWVNEFKHGRTSTCNRDVQLRLLRQEIIDKVHDIVLTDRRVKVRELITVISILHELGMKKLSAREVLRLFTVNHKRLEMFQRNPRFNILKKKRPHLAKKKVLFHAPMAKFNEFRYELLPHPAYSPDLAPCDYFLFPNLKKWFGGKRFTREQLIAETEAFEGLDKSYYSDGLKKLKNHWIKCIELKRDYVEK